MTFNHGVEGSNPSRRTQHSYRGMDRVNEVGFHTPKRLKCSVRVDIVARLKVERLSTAISSVKGCVWVRTPPSHLNEKKSEPPFLEDTLSPRVSSFPLVGTVAGAPSATVPARLYHMAQDLSIGKLHKYLKNFYPKFVQLALDFPLKI